MPEDKAKKIALEDIIAGAIAGIKAFNAANEDKQITIGELFDIPKAIVIGLGVENIPIIKL